MALHCFHALHSPDPFRKRVVFREDNELTGRAFPQSGETKEQANEKTRMDAMYEIGSSKLSEQSKEALYKWVEKTKAAGLKTNEQLPKILNLMAQVEAFDAVTKESTIGQLGKIITLSGSAESLIRILEAHLKYEEARAEVKKKTLVLLNDLKAEMESSSNETVIREQLYSLEALLQDENLDLEDSHVIAAKKLVEDLKENLMLGHTDQYTPELMNNLESTIAWLKGESYTPPSTKPAPAPIESPLDERDVPGTIAPAPSAPRTGTPAAPGATPTTPTAPGTTPGSTPDATPAAPSAGPTAAPIVVPGSVTITPEVREAIRTELARANLTAESTSEEVKDAMQAVLNKRAEEAKATIQRAEDAEAKRTEAILTRAEDLSKKTRAKLPAELKNEGRFFLARNFRDFDYGYEVISALDTLRGISGHKTEMELFQDIRDKKLASDTISFGEITRAVYKKSPDEVETELLRESEKIRQNKVSGDELLATQAKMDELDRFITASQRLLENIPKLKRRALEANPQYKNAPEEVQQAESLVGYIFDRNDRGPTAKVSVLRKIFKPGEDRTMNMQLYYENYKYEDDTVKNMSGAAAYQQLMHDVTDANETSVDEDKLIARLNELRKKGITVASADPELMQQLPANNVLPDFTKAILEEPKSIRTFDLELIRLGMALDQGDRFLEQKHQDIEFLKGKYSDLTDQAIDELVATQAFTAEEIAVAAERIEQQVIAAVGIMINKTPEGTTVGAGVDFPIDLGKGVTLHLGAAQNAFTGRFEVHGGLAKQFEKDRFTFGLAAGAQASKERVGLGAGAHIGIALDKYKEFSLGLGLGAGLDPTKASLIGLAASLGVSRDLGGTLEKKVAKLEEKQREDMNKALSQLEAEMKPHMTEAHWKELKAQTEAHLAEQIKSGAIEDMNGVQFLGAGIAIVPFGPINWPIPYLALSLGKKREIVYSKPQDAKLTTLADRRIEAAIAEREGSGYAFNRVYSAGTLELNNEGLKTLSRGFRKEELEGDALAAHNNELAPHGVNLETVGEGAEKRLKLNINKAAGRVEVYSDSEGGVEINPGKNGEILVNLGSTEQLSLRRVDEYYPFEKFGATQHTKIYLSNKIGVSNKAIESNSAKHIVLSGGKAEVVTQRDSDEGEKSAVFKSEAAMLEAGISLDSLDKDLATLKNAREAMDKAIGYRPSLSVDRAKLDQVAVQVLAKNKLTYRQLSVEKNYPEIVKMINETTGKTDWSNAEYTYLQQSLMIATLAKEPKQLREHIQGWNKRALENGLKAEGMPADDAKRISDKIMEAYAKDADTLGLSAIGKGDILHVRVGTMNVKGYREAFYDPIDALEMLGAKDLTSTRELVAMGLSEADAKLFIETVTNQLSPLKPDAELFRSQLGLSVLDAADLIFGAEKTLKLAQMVKEKNTTVDSALFEEYKAIVNALRNNRTYTLANGTVLGVDLTKTMGFYEKCHNFSLTINEKLSIHIPVNSEAVSTQVRDFVEGHVGAKFIGVGVAAAVGTTPPRERKPVEPQPNEAGSGDAETLPEGLPGENDNPTAGPGDSNEESPRG